MRLRTPDLVTISLVTPSDGPIPWPQQNTEGGVVSSTEAPGQASSSEPTQEGLRPIWVQAGEIYHTWASQKCSKGPEHIRICTYSKVGSGFFPFANFFFCSSPNRNWNKSMYQGSLRNRFMWKWVAIAGAFLSLQFWQIHTAQCDSFSN